ncbi:bacterial type II secretion system domain protein F [Aeromicrobium marinum DSM 15272]|uniref:Bacterial type II secretion system domain protein F n=1 Tax=Aeromicrobium marinum DSM 15272 TaxID=585531 RepID=E2SFI2_9ACTN|nr:type II secretion system F family protein [Aeromicrobium marinum]EFQ82083.1 bacterial type II secretion system domain protein F [Aeromicrobium marinum DSM 15272]
MLPALVVAAAVWLVVPGPPLRRRRALTAEERPRRRPPPGLVVGVLTVGTGIVVVGWPWGAVVGAAAVPTVRRLVDRAGTTARQRRQAEMVRLLPAALDLVVTALEAGRSPGGAFAVVADAAPAPLAEELRGLARRLEVAADPLDVWDALVRDPTLAPVGRALRRSEVTGMPAARVVARVADDLRRTRRAEIAHRSRSVGVATAAPLGLCFLPAFFLVGIVPTVVGMVRVVAP